MTLIKRLGSMLLDHAIMCTVSVIAVFPLFLIGYLQQSDIHITLPSITGIIIFLIYYNKDFLRAKSPAKRIVGLQVVNNKSGKPASPIKCFIRNLTIVLWPIEVFITLFSKDRRLGDLIAGTRVVQANTESIGTIFKELKTLISNK